MPSRPLGRAGRSPPLCPACGGTTRSCAWRERRPALRRRRAQPGHFLATADCRCGLHGW